MWFIRWPTCWPRSKYTWGTWFASTGTRNILGLRLFARARARWCRTSRQTTRESPLEPKRKTAARPTCLPRPFRKERSRGSCRQRRAQGRLRKRARSQSAKKLTFRFILGAAEEKLVAPFSPTAADTKCFISLTFFILVTAAHRVRH